MLKTITFYTLDTKQIRKVALLGFLLFGVTGVAFAQFKGSYTGTIKQHMKQAKAAYDLKDYYNAMINYGVVLENKPNDIGIRYAYAESARMLGSYTVAENAYTMVIDQREEGYFPLSGFWLANVKQRLGKYKEAISVYAQFLEGNTGNEKVPTYYLQRAKKEKADSEWARALVLTPQNLEVEHLGEEVNTGYNEYGMYMQGDTLYFTRMQYESEVDESESQRLYSRLLRQVDGGVAEEVTDLNDVTRHTSNITFNADNSRAYYTLCDYVDLTAEIKCALYYRDVYADGSWGAEIRLPDHINVPGKTTAQPSVNYDKVNEVEYLYFASDREEGKGKMDIWYVEVPLDSIWSDPVNMEEINTEEDDLTPFYHTNSRTFYFSSEGVKENMGGFDVYKVKQSREGVWGEPENMGNGINSSLNDVYFKLNGDGSRGYVASNRLGSNFLDEENEVCCNDIYTAEFDIQVELLLTTFDGASGDDLVGVTVRLLEVLEDGSTEEVSILSNDNDNNFVFYLEREKKYILEGSKDGYVTNTLEIDVPIDAPEQLIEELHLMPITASLQALVYDLDTELPLSGATVQLVEIDGEEERIVQEQTNDLGNDFQFPLELNKNYVIRAIKPGYKPLDGLELSTYDLTKPEIFNADLYLKRTGFGDLLPLAIYFDNDYPDVDSRSRRTSTSYEELVDPYYVQKDQFTDIYTEPLSDEEAFLTAGRYEAFFEREVKKGFDDLQAFAEALLLFLESGNELSIRLKGFASPRSLDNYNYNLSFRRIYSVENFLRNYKGGVLAEYMDDGRLNIDREPLGERTAPNYVTDILEDERNSIYDLGASLERRVEIVEGDIRLSDQDSSSNLNGGGR